MGEERAELSVVLTDDAELRDLNRTYRGVDAPTDVLSFPQREGEGNPAPNLLGDVVISVPRAVEQAERYGHSTAREVGFLTVHGILHLLGWDHQTAEEEARMMAASEAILQGLGLVRPEAGP
jgi:probable rRNA maturation factor